MANIKLKHTERGFDYIEFEDGNGSRCSLQESSAARDEGLIWLGTKTDRMHLTQSQVKELLPYLEYFVKEGVLPDE